MNEDLLKIISECLACPAIRTRSLNLHHLPKAAVTSISVLLLVHQRNNAAWPQHLLRKYVRKFTLTAIQVFITLPLAYAAIRLQSLSPRWQP